MVYSISECKFCEDFLLKTLRTRLAVFERKSSIFPHRAPEAAEAFRESQSSKLDEPFLSGPNSRPEWRKLPFFSDLHHEISRSWKKPFSFRLTNAASANGLIWSGRTGLLLQLHWVTPDCRVRRRSVLPHEAVQDLLNVSSCLLHTLLTHICHIRPVGFCVQ